MHNLIINPQFIGSQQTHRKRRLPRIELQEDRGEHCIEDQRERRSHLATSYGPVGATCKLRWSFPEEERMMQYSRYTYFPQLRTKVINPVGETHRTSLATPTHTKANTCTQRKTRGCQSLVG
jgi:hypothetical protein